MRIRHLPLLVALITLSGCAKVNEIDATARATGGFFNFGSGKDKALKVMVSFSPNPVRVGKSGSMDVTVAIVNNTKQQQTLGTETQQRINVQVTEVSSGRVVAQMQEGRSEDPRLTSPLLNPGEQLSFVRKVSTRDLRAGQTYEILGYVVGYENKLRGTVQFVPQ
jgi:hypothetical protein